VSREAALQLVDAVARHVVERARPVRFARVRGVGTLDAVLRLRFRTVVEEGWAPAGEFPDGVERDGYDDEALHIAGWQGRRLAAAARIVLPRPGRLLPTEETFSLEIEPRGKVVDWSRLVVAPPFRGSGRRVLHGLLGACWLETRSHGYAAVCAADSPAMIRLYRSLGFEISVLGASQAHWREERFPVRFEVADSHGSLARWGASSPRSGSPAPI
jgi:N-acyl-L-homoserine lactone synthetase